MSYIDGLRFILNEIEVAGKKPTDDGSDGESDNFMDDTEDTAPADDQTPDDTSTPDDTGDDGESDNFMDDEGDTSTDEGEPNTDDTGDDGESDNFMDDEGDAGDDTGEAEPAGDDTGAEGDDGGEGDSDNFMDDGDGEGEEGSEEGGDEGETSDDGGDEGEEGDDFGIDKIEDELFSSLTPEQKAIKNEELKNQFIALYSVIGSTLDRINDVSKSNENVAALAFITQKLLELREMIDYTITTSYATKTYIENNITYQQCISTLNLISEMISKIPSVNGEENDDDQNVYKGAPVEPDDNKEIKSLDISDTSVADYQAESASPYNDLF